MLIDCRVMKATFVRKKSQTVSQKDKYVIKAHSEGEIYAFSVSGLVYRPVKQMNITYLFLKFLCFSQTSSCFYMSAVQVI